MNRDHDMADLEHRLRAALRSVTEQAPAGLAEAIGRRRRRHRFRVGSGVLAVAAAAALAVPPLTGALDGSTTGQPGPGRGHGPERSLPIAIPVHRGPIHVAPGTVLAGCGSADLGQIGAGWRKGSTREAGPLWFLNGGNSRLGSGPAAIRLYAGIIVLSDISPRSVVVLKVARADRGRLRFLFGRHDSLNPGTRYTMRSGESGVTFVACRFGQGIAPAPGVTDYYGGFLIRGARCVTADAWLPGRARPARIRFGLCTGR